MGDDQSAAPASLLVGISLMPKSNFVGTTVSRRTVKITAPKKRHESFLEPVMTGRNANRASFKQSRIL